MIKPGLDSLSDIKYEPPKTLANKFVEQISEIDSEGIRKIVVDENTMNTMLADPSSAEAGLLMQQLMGNKNSKENSNNSLPSEAAELMKQMLGNHKVEANPDAGADLIRKRPDYLEKAIQDAKSRDRFEIDIENTSVLDLFVGKSTKKDVVNALKTLSRINYENSQESIFYYTDIGLSFYFDENDILNEIEVDEKYKRQTTKGLKINDTLDKAIELYGPPRMKSAKGAIWNKFSVLMADKHNEIRLIRLKIRS